MNIPAIIFTSQVFISTPLPHKGSMKQQDNETQNHPFYTLTNTSFFARKRSSTKKDQRAVIHQHLSTFYSLRTERLIVYNRWGINQLPTRELVNTSANCPLDPAFVTPDKTPIENHPIQSVCWAAFTLNKSNNGLSLFCTPNILQRLKQEYH